MKHPDYLNLLIAIDQLINTWFGGSPDETLSSRAYRHRESKPWAYKLINMLFFWQEDHCRDAYLAEMERLHLPPSMR